LLSFGRVLILGSDKGGYWPTAWGWTSLVLLFVAAVVLIVRNDVRIGTLETILPTGLQFRTPVLSSCAPLDPAASPPFSDPRGGALGGTADRPDRDLPGVPCRHLLGDAARLRLRALDQAVPGAARQLRRRDRGAATSGAARVLELACGLRGDGHVARAGFRRSG